MAPDITTPGFLQFDTECTEKETDGITNMPFFSNLTIHDNSSDNSEEVSIDECTLSGMIFHQKEFDTKMIPPTWILLDSQSTISIFSNRAFLTNIRDAQTPLILQSNGGGRQKITQVGDFVNFGTIWYCPDSLANILSLADVRRQNRVTIFVS